MSDLEFIRKSLQHDLGYWKERKEAEPDNAFYRGTVAGLEALNEKIKFVFKEEEEKEQCQTD